MAKLKVGVFALTSCSGCQFECVEANRDLALLEHLDFTHWDLVHEHNPEGPFDVSFVEGAVTKPEEIEELKKIRERTKFLVALGTCATYGGIPAMKNFFTQREIERMVYSDSTHILSMKANGLSEYVNVDYQMYGCPIVQEEFLSVVKALLSGAQPKHKNYGVCVECRERENPCLLKKQRLCMGPITYAGCNALCPSNNIPCYGCRGPFEGVNVESEVKLLKKFGFGLEDIRRAFIQFAGTSKKFEGIV
jgi:coenzyme F420-reducing hydrogenase gamma subunit